MRERERESAKVGGGESSSRIADVTLIALRELVLLRHCPTRYAASLWRCTDVSALGSRPREHDSERESRTRTLTFRSRFIQLPQVPDLQRKGLLCRTSYRPGWKGQSLDVLPRVSGSVRSSRHRSSRLVSPFPVDRRFTSLASSARVATRSSNRDCSSTMTETQVVSCAALPARLLPDASSARRHTARTVTPSRLARKATAQVRTRVETAIPREFSLTSFVHSRTPRRSARGRLPTAVVPNSTDGRFFACELADPTCSCRSSSTSRATDCPAETELHFDSARRTYGQRACSYPVHEGT